MATLKKKKGVCENKKNIEALINDRKMRRKQNQTTGQCPHKAKAKADDI